MRRSISNNGSILACSSRFLGRSRKVASALYLGKTVYRIHGTNQPSTIGTFVSSGCIRLTNEDVADLYTRVKVGTRVVVLPGKPPATAAATSLAPPAPPAGASAPSAAASAAPAGPS